MTDPFCVGGGRRLPGSTKSGPGKDGGRNEVRLPVLHDPPKLGKRDQAKVNSWRPQAVAAGCGTPPLLPAPRWSSSWVPTWATWALKSLPRVGQLGLWILVVVTRVSQSPCFTVGEVGLTSGLTSALDGRQGCGKCSFQAFAYCVLQGCRWSGVGRQCPARAHSALIQEVQPVTGQKGRKRGVQKPRTRPSETFL